MRRMLVPILLLAALACSLPFSGVEEVQPAATQVSPPNSTPVAQPLPPSSGPNIAGCQILPADNIWNTPVSNLPVHPDSAVFIDSIGPAGRLHPDFGSGLYEGGPIGIPFQVVGDGLERVDVSFEYDDESDAGPYPIPPDAPIEGGSESDGDRHVIIIDSSDCTLYELFFAFPEADGSWSAAAGAIFDLTSNDLRPESWTSADAAGLPILPGLVRYEEVRSGAIHHALRFTAAETQRASLWPARHFASTLTDNAFPPMGLRLRLRADFDISGFSPDVRVILNALKTYGMILADNGSPWYISGVPDENWNNDVLSELSNVPGSAFEAVDVSSLQVNPDSGQVQTASAPVPTLASGRLGGTITYSLPNERVYRIAAIEGAKPVDVSAALDKFSVGTEDYWLNISPAGDWHSLVTDRFGCQDWACLAVLPADLSSAEAVIANGDLVHPEGIPAIASGGNLIVYPAPDGPHEMDLWVVQRQDAVWSAPALLTEDSTFDFHRYPAISADGSRILFTCEEAPLDTFGKSLCEVNVDGSGFHLVLTPQQGPGGTSLSDLHQPDYAPDGSLIFEADLNAEQIWRLAPGAAVPVLISTAFGNDNSPCVLPDGRIVSLWLDRPGATGAHEIKVMLPDGSMYYIAMPDVDVFDIGLGCGE